MKVCFKDAMQTINGTIQKKNSLILPYSQETDTCPKSTIETLEKGVKYAIDVIMVVLLLIFNIFYTFFLLFRLLTVSM